MKAHGPDIADCCLSRLFISAYFLKSFVNHRPKCFLNYLKKIKSVWSQCLKTKANEHCYGEFQYNCETNGRNV